MSGAQTVLLSLAAAVLYALASVLQQSAAAVMGNERSMRPGLLVDLVRRPRWVVGNMSELGAFAMQFLALRRGSLLVVETVLVSGLLFALPIGAALDHRRPRRTELLWALVVVICLAVFLAAATPTEGQGEASGAAWIAVLAVSGTVIAMLIACGNAQAGRRRATRLGAACGVLFGVCTALAKASAHLLALGLGHALASWEPYALLVFGAFGVLLAQSAFQAGPLVASLPVLTIFNPLVAAAIGVLAFHERIAATPGAVAIEAASVVTMVVGVFALTRSPVVTQPAGAA